MTVANSVESFMSGLLEMTPRQRLKKEREALTDGRLWTAKLIRDVRESLDECRELLLSAHDTEPVPF